MKRFSYTASLFLFCTSMLFGVSKTVLISTTIQHQTIDGFGASDGWNAQCVGDWNDAAKAPIVQLLFSKEMDASGNPLGIGLSRWRFNIGAGSATQGDDSNIDDPSRRSDCFLQADGSYDWTLQDGERWFLQQAKAYGVEKMIAWVNSPPIYYTKNGRANTDNTSNYGSSNLMDDKYSAFATFLTTVLDHFEQEEGITFDMLSPVNEPQYTWNSKQEGTPWRNDEIARLAREINTALIEKELDVNMFVAEAGSYKYTYKWEGSGQHSDQMDDFFAPASSNYIGNLEHMTQGISSHSYWVNNYESTMKSVRENVASKAKARNLNVYQTEYSMLSVPDESHFPINSKFDRALFLAKLIHYDLTISNCVSWSYWTAIDRERWDHSNRFYLINVVPNNGIYSDFTESTSGTHSADKNLWVLGNYSRFIRPGYVRLNTIGSDDSDFMCSSYLSPDSAQVVSVYINTTIFPLTLQQSMTLPNGYTEGSTDLYATTKTSNLQFRSQSTQGESISLPGRSVCTTVTQLSKSTALDKHSSATSSLKLYPNPSQGKVLHIDGLKGKSQVCIYAANGRKVYQTSTTNHSPIVLDTPLEAGLYFVHIWNENNEILEKLIIQ